LASVHGHGQYFSVVQVPIKADDHPFTVRRQLRYRRSERPLTPLLLIGSSEAHQVLAGGRVDHDAHLVLDTSG
jgi:hypothetical protein